MLGNVTRAVVGFMVAASPALAHHKPGHEIPAHARAAAHSVPEIDASAGFLALAAIATVMLYVWERSRRQKT